MTSGPAQYWNFTVKGRRVRATFLRGSLGFGFGLGFDATPTSLGITLGTWSLDIFWNFNEKKDEETRVR